MPFLYRYLFRGIGLVLVIGMLTILALAIRYELTRPGQVQPHGKPAEVGRP